jgi:hypothetical protein
MTYRGRIKNGAVILDRPVSLPDGSEVEVRPVTQGEAIPTLYERYKDFIGIAEDLPTDMAENHDHYIHGAPKRAS